jgi:hypothetical protein
MKIKLSIRIGVTNVLNSITNVENLLNLIMDKSFHCHTLTVLFCNALIITNLQLLTLGMYLLAGVLTVNA